MKSRMLGAVNAYVKMFLAIRHWGESPPPADPILGNIQEDYIYETGCFLDDACFHGWNGDAIKNENNVFKKVSSAYYLFLKSLGEAIGYQWSENDPVWNYHLKFLDMDVLLNIEELQQEK